MKRIFLLTFIFCCMTTVVFAQTNTSSVPAAVSMPVAENAITLKGDIIDNLCANGHKDTLADFVKTHTKECAIAPGCSESGYSIFADGKLYKFDKDSSVKVAEFLKKADSKLQVAATVKDNNGEVSLIFIENQK